MQAAKKSNPPRHKVQEVPFIIRPREEIKTPVDVFNELYWALQQARSMARLAADLCGESEEAEVTVSAAALRTSMGMIDDLLEQAQMLSKLLPTAHTE